MVNLIAAMVVVADPLALEGTVVAVEEVEEESSAIPANGCGRNNGTSTSSRSLRKTSTNSIQMLPAGLRYVTLPVMVH